MGLQSRLYYLEKQVKELADSVKKTALTSPQDAAMSDAGMNTDIGVGGMGEFLGKVYAARVQAATDTLHGGHLSVICDQVHGAQAFTCKMASPFGGAGYGLFAVPGAGASVLITEVQGEGWVWFSCLFNLEVEAGGTATVVDPKGTGSEAQKSEAEDPYAKLGREEGDPMQMTHGVPESFLAYAENNEPEQYIWKTPKGHKIIMSEKHTENCEEKHITIQSAGGKRIILDDADARTEIGTEPSMPTGQTGDRIIIADGDEWEEEGGPNRIWIQSTAGEEGVEDSIQVYARNSLFLEAREGNINMTVLDSEVEDAHILITNLASGNLEMDIEEGDIAAAAKYRICLNAWNEDDTLPHLGTIGMKSKGSFTVQNGFGEISQNLQMVNESGTVALNANKSGLLLLGGDVTRAQLMSETIFITAMDTIHLDADKISFNANSIDFNQGPQIDDRDFSDHEDLPIGEGLAPCDLLEDDKELEFLTNTNGPGWNVDITDAGGVGGGNENVTEEEEEDEEDPPDHPEFGGVDDDGIPPPPVGGPGYPGGGGVYSGTPDNDDRLFNPPKNPPIGQAPMPPTPPGGSLTFPTPSVPMVPNSPGPGPPTPPSPPSTPSLPSSGPTTPGRAPSVPMVPNTPSGPPEGDLEVTFYDKIPGENIRFTASPPVGGGGGPGDGEGGGGGLGLDTDTHHSGNFGGGGGGGGGEEEGGGPTISYNTVEGEFTAADAAERNMMNSSSPGGGIPMAPGGGGIVSKSSWFNITNRGGVSESNNAPTTSTVQAGGGLTYSATRSPQQTTVAETGETSSPNTQTSRATTATPTTATGGEAGSFYGL